jgi:UDPglucose--hexose-1-phosphate uridylyltransferase
VGIHDVIIDSPRHDLSIALLAIEQVFRILKTYREQYALAAADPRIEQVTVFKNHGATAGTSLEHPHSQLVATPIVPSQIRDRVAQAMNYYDEHRECVFCHMIRDELAQKVRIIAESRSFVAFIPYAAFSPFHTWILPKRHEAAFPRMEDHELFDFAEILKLLLKKLYLGLDNPDYNYVIRSLPGRPRPNAFFHWYLSIVPRVSKTAGFELGSGMYINTALPEDSAEFLRGIKV